jgi:hypothetical protein
MAGASSTASFFVRPDGPVFRLDMLVSPIDFTGLPTSLITAIASYSMVDPAYVWAAADLNVVGNTVDGAAVAAGDVWIFETYDGYRGKLNVNSRTTTNTPGDTLNFDMIVWDYAGAVINSAAGVDIIACASGNCYFDFHMSPPVVTGSPNADFQWSLSGGSFALVPNQNSVMRLIQ